MSIKIQRQMSKRLKRKIERIELKDFFEQIDSELEQADDKDFEEGAATSSTGSS